MQNQHEDQTRQQYIRMTQTPIGKLIGTLAIPTIISMLVTNIYNTADTYFVSRLGTSASGAVGIVFAFMTFYQAIGFMCGHGAGSFVARFLGAKSPDKAKMFAASTFFLSSLLGTLLSLAFYLNLNRVLYFLGSTKTILPYARQYAVWILIAGPFLSASCTLNNLLRYEGRAMYAMIGLTTGGILNMIGDPILMFGFGMGVSGRSSRTSPCPAVYLPLADHQFSDSSFNVLHPYHRHRCLAAPYQHGAFHVLGDHEGRFAQSSAPGTECGQHHPAESAGEGVR